MTRLKGSQLKIEKWRSAYPAERMLNWHDDWLENEYCKDCRYCCGPQGDDDPFPMALLPRQIGPDNIDNFYMLDENTAYLGARGCKSDTETGCRLTVNEKPVACGLFPIVLANGRLYLYRHCPAVFFTPLERFMGYARQASMALAQYKPDELRHISITLPPEVLAEKYIDLDIVMFEDGDHVSE